MMLIICSDKPDKAVDWLVENTNKRFVWKQTLELTQLLATCGITDQMEPLRQGKQICEWIKRNENIYFVNGYYGALLSWCEDNIKMLPATWLKLLKTRVYLWQEAKKCRTPDEPIKTAIWRYSKEYSSEYPTNSELDIDLVCELYKTYLREFKGFGKKEV